MARVDEIQTLCRDVSTISLFHSFDIEILHRSAKDFAAFTQVEFQTIKNKIYCQKKEIKRRYGNLFAPKNYELKGWSLQ